MPRWFGPYLWHARAELLNNELSAHAQDSMWEAIAMSSVLEFVAACCLALALSFPGQHAGPDLDSTNPYASLEGQLCSPPRKETCGEVTDLGMLSAPAPRSQFG